MYGSQSPDITQLVSEDDIVDELWNDQKRRRTVRVSSLDCSVEGQMN